MDGFRSVLRPASRLVFHSVSRSVPRFALRFIPSLASPFVSPLGPFSPFRSSPRLSPSPSFRLSVWACRVGGSWGRAVLFCSSGAGGRLCFFSCPGVVAAIGRGGACRVVDGVGFADVVSWASVRDESDAVRRGVGRVARRGVGRGVVAFVGYGNYATNGRTMGQRRIGNGRRDDVR